ncbi:hypothetical protein FSP39_003575 [Pinctada imbricata]|uniref:GOLD domain-containing protein n=1 Tax=Pinctada imbricata TaxID=66713 RepID=A0AA88YFP8_PINIB|nr:hypothetical protein FSP39_003575 [Pinctada imbricata]
MAVLYNRILTFFVCVLHLHKSLQEKVLGQTTDDFDFDGLPGAQHEFKVEIPPGIEDCFVQKVAQGANLHVSFEVLNDPEAKLDLYIKDQSGKIIVSDTETNSAQVDHDIEIQGDYHICIDNTYARFSTKLVYVYIVTFVMEEWSKYVQEVHDVNSAVVNFTTSISAVEMSIEMVKMHQSHSRMNVIKDWYLITGNQDYVYKWSVAQIVVILCCSIFQVYFVRRLFRVPNVTPMSKPRA